LFDVFARAEAHWQTVLYDRLYAILTSLFASMIVTWVILQLRIRDRLQKGRTMLGLLGLLPSEDVGQVAIVVPAFPIPSVKVKETNFVHPEKIHDIVRSPLPDNILKSWGEMQTYAYARRDMLLVLDLARLIAAAGLPPPLVVSDYDFLQTVQDSITPGRHSNVLQISTDGSAPARVSHVILVGLWSNVATMMLQSTPGVPFEMHGKGEDREVRLLIPRIRGPHAAAS